MRTGSLNEGDTVILGLDSPAELGRLRDGVLALLRHELGNSILAEDLCNETFRIVLERLRERPLEEPDKLASYLAQTARNLAHTSKRVVRRQKTDTGQQSTIESLGDPAPDPAESSHADMLARAVRRLLAEIPNTRDREILVRTYLRDEDREEICRALGIDESHYRRVVSRARSRFRELIGKRYRVSDLYGFALV